MKNKWDITRKICLFELLTSLIRSSREPSSRCGSLNRSTRKEENSVWTGSALDLITTYFTQHIMDGCHHRKKKHVYYSCLYLDSGSSADVLNCFFVTIVCLSLVLYSKHLLVSDNLRCVTMQTFSRCICEGSIKQPYGLVNITSLISRMFVEVGFQLP